MALEPHRWHGFKLSRDKHCVEKLTDPAELNLNPPHKAAVPCVVIEAIHDYLEENQAKPKPFT